MSISVPDLRRALARHPRVRLATLPTPLQPAPRFSAAVGHEVWIKRDDLTGLALGGNKARKLEFSLGAAQAGGADCVVSVGAPQSNHARSVAAAARVLGWECHLVLGGDRPDRPTGNLVLDVALGATLHFAGSDDWADLEARADDLCAELRRAGRRPVVVPMGGSTGTGALGFVTAYLELLEQCGAAGLEPGALVLATSTGGTQAGLTFAHACLDAGPEVLGAGVAKTQTDLRADVVRLQQELAGLTGLTPRAELGATVLEGYLGAGYARPTPGGQHAFDLLAGTEAVLTDPVYSAKGLHAVVDLARNTADPRPLVFWHTGGQPALFSDSVGITTWPAHSDTVEEVTR